LSLHDALPIFLVLAAVAVGSLSGATAGGIPRKITVHSGERGSAFRVFSIYGDKAMFSKLTLRKLLASTLFAGCAAFALGAAAPAAAETIDQVKEKGELTIGMLVDFPPYGILNTENKPDGYDADVARLLAKDLGVKLNIVPVTGPNRIPFLLTNKVDMLVASLAITPERAKQVQFSHPYSAAQIVVFGAKGDKIAKPEDLSGLRIGVARASTQDIAV